MTISPKVIPLVSVCCLIFKPRNYAGWPTCSFCGVCHFSQDVMLFCYNGQMCIEPIRLSQPQQISVLEKLKILSLNFDLIKLYEPCYNGRDWILQETSHFSTMQKRLLSTRYSRLACAPLHLSVPSWSLWLTRNITCGVGTGVGCKCIFQPLSRYFSL